MSRFELPSPGPPTPVRFPAVDRRTLDNGTRVWTLSHTAVPVVTVTCVMDAGTASDPHDRPGLASLVGGLVTEGAGTRDAIEIGDTLARIGGQFSVETDADVTTLSLTVLARHFEAGLGLLADVVRRPTLLPADFERVRDLRLGRLRQASHTPATIADRALVAAVFGEHPYGHGALGTTRAVTQVSLDEVRDWWAANWQPADTSIVVAGDVDGDRVHRALARAFGDWAPTGPGPRPVPAPVDAAGGGVFTVDRPGAAQAELRVGHLGPARRTPDYHALTLLNAIVGGQFTSRINRRLREGMAVTYGARSSFDMRRAGGLFSCDSSVQTDAVARAATQVLAELDDVARDGAISAEELDAARASLTRGYVRHFETTAQLARAMAQLVAHRLDHDTFDTFVPAVNHLPSSELVRAARAYLRPADAVIIVVGDIDALLETLTSLGRPISQANPEF